MTGPASLRLFQGQAGNRRSRHRMPAGVAEQPCAHRNGERAADEEHPAHRDHIGQRPERHHADGHAQIAQGVEHAERTTAYRRIEFALHHGQARGSGRARRRERGRAILSAAWMVPLMALMRSSRPFGAMSRRPSGTPAVPVRHFGGSPRFSALHPTAGPRNSGSVQHIQTQVRGDVVAGTRALHGGGGVPGTIEIKRTSHPLEGPS